MRKPGAYTTVVSSKHESNIDSEKLISGFQNLGHATKPMNIDFSKQK
jgi:predicted HAD superfamily phosphohydrolase YqeG